MNFFENLMKTMNSLSLENWTNLYPELCIQFQGIYGYPTQVYVWMTWLENPWITN